jgi:hypothetical protein
MQIKVSSREACYLKRVLEHDRDGLKNLAHWEELAEADRKCNIEEYRCAVGILRQIRKKQYATGG